MTFPPRYPQGFGAGSRLVAGEFRLSVWKVNVADAGGLCSNRNRGSSPGDRRWPRAGQRKRSTGGCAREPGGGLAAEWQPPWQLPRTSVEDTVLDLVSAARNFDDAYGWISAAVGRRLTTPDLLS